MDNKIIKPYMAYSKIGGAGEGAVLVFSYASSEARKLAWTIGWIRDLCDNDWIDLRAEPIKPDTHIMQQAKSSGPHIVEAPETCIDCELWGYSLDEDGRCESCREEIEWLTEVEV